MKPLTLIALGLASGFAAAADSFYKEAPLFSTAPAETSTLQAIDRFGPVGIGIELHQPAFVMKVKNVEEGSPAATTGQLKSGQIIETINGEKLKDIDPRIQLGHIITAAEAADGLVKLVIRDAPDAAPREVVVNIPVLGAYSKTWPLDCPKSDKILRAFGDYMAKPGSERSFGDIGMLVLLGTGEDKDLEVVRRWARKAANSPPTYAWHLGYGGIPLTEYYLRTGDASVLPGIQLWVNNAVKAQFLDGWAGRGGVPSVTYGGGGGHLNAGGTAVVTFLMLAKECGADVPDHALHGALTQFFRFAGRGNNPYGNSRPESTFVDNGKNGNLAFAMAAAASLTPAGENSIYARARDAVAMTSFYTTTYMLHGHTGGGIGEIWRSAAMGLLAEKRPNQYREFMDNRMWHYELSRRWDGSFAILGGDKEYDNASWGAGYVLGYVIPRKNLRVTGAPPSKFSKKYQLPERPWGTQEDDAFLSLESAADAGGRRLDLSKETLPHDSGKPLIERLNAMGDISDDVLRSYARHQDVLVRQLATKAAMGIEPNYMWIKAGGRVRLELVREWIQSKDARVRHAALAAILAALRTEKLESVLPRETFDLLFPILKNPEESWWIKDAALQLVGHAPADWVAPHVDLLVPYLKHKEWWLQSAALMAVTPVVIDERCYQKVLPAVGAFLATNQRWNASAGPMEGICAALSQGSDAVQRLARETLKESYTGFTGVKTAPGGQDISTTYDSQLAFLASTLTNVQGGYDLLYEIGKERFPGQTLPYSNIFLDADPGKFGPKLQEAFKPIILNQLVHEFIGRNRVRLQPVIHGTQQSETVTCVIDELVGIYQKAGVHDYDWRVFGPDLKDATWDYFSFDPPEKQNYELSPWRYRKVTYPSGMENWFQPGFDPATARWKKGQAPFGQYEGKLVTDANPRGRFVCAAPMRSLWEQEVLLVRGTFQFPALNPQHFYRIRVSTGQGVGSGDGYMLYINGKPLLETKEGLGRRGGQSLRGAYITKEFFGEFAKGPVTLAATTFLRYGDRAVVSMPPVPQGMFSFWLEEMKLPPADDKALHLSANFVPMLSSAWQDKQDPENAKPEGSDDRFRYDGKFVANPKAIGNWSTVAMVLTIDEFSPDKPSSDKGAPMSNLSLVDAGLTNSATMIWSGDMLMDLSPYQALKITPKTIDGADYLFVEAGGFSDKHPAGWKSPLIVMKRN